MSKIAVVGTTFLDIKGFPSGSYDAKGTNIGSVVYVHGGVARNVAEDLANLGVDVKLITTVDKGGAGDEIVKHLENAGVDVSSVCRTEKDGLGTWLAIMDENNDLAGSISKQPDFELLREVLTEEAFSGCKACAITIDAKPEITEKAFGTAKKLGLDIYVVIGNLAGLPENYDALSGAKCFVCNYIEAEHILALTLDRNSESNMISACKTGTERLGCDCFIITCGEKGAAYYDALNEKADFVAAEKTEMIDSTGAGDAFFSGVTAAMLSGMDTGRAVVYGTRLAAVTIGVMQNTCPVMKAFLQ